MQVIYEYIMNYDERVSILLPSVLFGMTSRLMSVVLFDNLPLFESGSDGNTIHDILVVV